MILTGKVIVVTGGAGLLGQIFCKAIVENGGVAIIGELDLEKANTV